MKQVKVFMTILNLEESLSAHKTPVGCTVNILLDLANPHIKLWNETQVRCSIINDLIKLEKPVRFEATIPLNLHNEGHPDETTKGHHDHLEPGRKSISP